MSNLFVSGWACDNTILPDTLIDVAFFDTTKELAKIENSIQWQDILLPKLLKLTTEQSIITAWSTGALLLLPLLDKLPYKEVHLYAPCLQFVASKNNPKGTKAIHLESMINALLSSRELTMKKFFRNCGKSEALSHSLSYTTTELQRGLQFLQQVVVSPVYSSKNVQLYHGEKDRIIPFSAGEIAAHTLHRDLHVLKGGHFQEQMFTHL